MGDSTQWIQHIELYVNSSATPNQQAASVDGLAILLKNDSLTLETLVREMEMYLTTTDTIIRSRGIFLLGELLTQLTSKPLSDTSVRTLVGFFTERLADWKALRGAIVGCLALLRRKNVSGLVTENEAKAFAQSYIRNLEVQSYGQHDRKLSFQLMECLLDRYGAALKDLGDDFFFQFCQSIDGEKDPQCLMYVFHITESLARLYPNPSGPLEIFSKELFEILGSYFPIHFTHPKDMDDDVKRDELSRALMLAFASTPFFEPYSIPLLLEKLSSSLPSSKVESLKYLSYCTAKYGPDRMVKHYQALWSSIKDIAYISPQSTLSTKPDSIRGMSFQENEITIQAFVLLQEAIQQDSSFINLILSDQDINIFTNSLNQYNEFDNISLQVKQRLHAVGRILSVCAKTSVESCNKVFENFFPLLRDVLGISPAKLNFGALYLCVQLIDASRYLTLSFHKLGSRLEFAHQTWWIMLQGFSESLAESFFSILRSHVGDNAQSAYVYLGVNGLQILATFSGTFLPVSISMYDNILSKLVSIVTSDTNKTFSWSSALKALVEIGLFLDKSNSERALSFKNIVVDKIVSLMSSDDLAISLSLKLEAAFDVGATRKDFMMRVVQGLDEAISNNLSEIYDLGNLERNKMTVMLLDTYSNKVLPWFLKTEDSEEIPLRFALSIWEKIENIKSFNPSPSENASNLLGAAMTAMKKAVGLCLVEGQGIILKKASGVLFSSNFSNSELKSKNEWLTSLFASIIIALRPQTSLPNGELVVNFFITTLLEDHIPSAHALGSLVNKLPLKTTGIISSNNITLDEALDLIFHNLTIQSAKTNTVIGLAWVGKGLLMRGHEKVKDITRSLLSLLTSDGASICDDGDVIKCAGDAFRIIMRDSEECLNGKFHAVIRPLYKQRFFSTIVPVLLSLVVKYESKIIRSMLYRAFAHVISDTPLTAILNESKKLIPILLDCLSMLSRDTTDKDLIYNVLLVLSGILTDQNGKEAVTENAPRIINQLVELTLYSNATAIRETAIQCLVAVSELPHTRIYPFITQVLRATSKALDDPKRIVRQEAVRCRYSWGSISSRSIHF